MVKFSQFAAGAPIWEMTASLVWLALPVFDLRSGAVVAIVVAGNFTELAMDILHPHTEGGSKEALKITST